MALKFQKLTVTKVVKETADAITIYFAIPDKAAYTYLPGQYLTLRVNVGGKSYNRAYSLCSSPVADDELAVTVKRTPGGLISNHLNDNLKPGDGIEVLPPLGNFVARPEASQRKHYVLIGAGSGITPLMAILRTVLKTEPESRITLLYGNRNESSIIFRERLNELCAANPGRLKVVHSLSQPENGWAGLCGRLTQRVIADQIETIIKEDSLDKEYFVCGPSAMMDDSVRALKGLGASPDRVHQEHFSAPLTNPMEDEKSTPVGGTEVGAKEGPGTYEVTIILDGETKVVTVRPQESVLEAALDNDMDPPYACMIGSCCTCKAKLKAGKVIMDDREGLTDAEIREGYVLTCQSHPTTPGVILNYDEV